jgi:hypothetical protein
MKEQEWYKQMLRKVITETENQNINTSEEMIKTLIEEISISKVKYIESKS